MPARPWFAFYPSDWRGDPKLRSCSPVSRLVWLEMMGLAHEAEPYGYVLLAGELVTPEQLAKIAGVAVRQVNTAIVELERAGVFSRNELGVPFSRRMVRDQATRLRRAAGGKDSLNNPNVPRSKDSIKDTSKDILLPIHKGPPQIPEVRSQKSEEQQQQLQLPSPPAAPKAVGKPNWLTPYLDAYTQHVGQIKESRLAKVVAPVRAQVGDEEAVYAFTGWCKDPNRGKSIVQFSARWRDYENFEVMDEFGNFTERGAKWAAAIKM